MGREHDLLDEAVRHQVYVEGVSTHTAGEVKARLAKVEKVVVDALGGQEITGLDADQLAGVLREIQQAELEVMTDGLGHLSGLLEKLALYETGYTAAALSAATRGIKIKTLKAGAAYQAALDNPLAATGEMLDGFLEDWTVKQSKAVANVVAKGYANGWSNSEILQVVRGTKAKGYRDGIVEQVGRNAEIVVRTAVQHVANTARMETWAKNSDVVQGYKIVATLDAATCSVCGALDIARVYQLGEGPTLPIHPGCRCTTGPVIAEEFAFLDEGATRSSATGYVPADETYYQWLQRQPASFQADAIGPTRAALLRDGGLSADEFARLNLGRNFQPRTLDEMRRKHPDAFERAGQ